MTLTAPNVAADLGDLTYDPTLTHRLVIQISGAARGTGSNTADGSNSGVASANIADPANIIYDFVPATGKAVTSANAQRNVVSTESCNSCHSKLNGLGFHGGSRNDARICVVCHTDQRKFGRTNSASTGGAFTGSPYIADGEVQGDFPVFIHKLHAGEALTKTGYNYAGVQYNHITYPQPVNNCVKCHSGAEATQAANWGSVPSRLACGSCHDGINWSTGAGHIGGSASNDANCALCHKTADITRYHVTVDPTGANGRAGYPLNTAVNVPTNGYPSGQGPSIPLASQLNLPSGVYKIAYEIKSVKVVGAAGAKKAQITYRILKDGQPVTLRSSGYLIDNVDGSPGLYIAYAAANTFGVAAPADWTTSFNVSVKNVRDGVGGNSQTGPDADGYYTATLATIIPDTATMVTGLVGIDYSGFVQLNHPAYPQGIRLNDAVFPMKVADGYNPRRSIVSAAKCNACHGQLGTGPSFHGGTRNNGEGCAVCHYNGRATGHVGASYNYGGGWSVSAKDLVHGIHGSGKRTVDYSYEATASNPAGFGHVTYPGVLKNCEQCHVAGSYDFSNTASKNALTGLLWSAALSGNFPDPGANTVIGLSPWVKSFGNGYEDYSVGAGANHLVISPITASCFGCHDTSSAVAHMQQNGGKLYVKRSTTLVGGVAVNTEACMACHGSGKIGDIKKVHSK
ncbi:OmcA/MtrC family decaheme c-type cytochrome [Trichlorobacter ammonificans]|uniref:Outer membrane cytochrome MtrC/MtrF-like domain-containing protein n=1 Tax=Trichlorobacter ammonificans TaxID=2916410 RepID=A0ABM9D978_9BACT|nr:OmcA/MtrC family decaheme c-type cytochrome [Trichlorobacter ammonificans]CAH2031778.1 conserved protein of unknown function [Trichlorobacter ammonificans]